MIAAWPATVEEAPVVQREDDAAIRRPCPEYEVDRVADRGMRMLAPGAGYYDRRTAA